MKKNRYFLLFSIIFFLIISFFVWQKWNGTKKEEAKDISDIKVIDEAFTIIKEKSVYGPSDQTIVEGALRGMADSLKDPYSTYYNQKEAALHKQTLAGQRVGIGIEIAERNGKFIVIAPVKSSPAEKAGIRPFDEIVQVDEVRLEGKTLGELLQLIQGKVGEEVSLVLYRPSTERHIKVTVKREEINNDTVTAKVLNVDDKKIGYVSISMFAENTAEEWVSATKQLIAENVEGIIIDLRDNPGGYLHSVAAVVSSLEKEGKVFAYMQNGQGAMTPLETTKLEEEGLYLKTMSTMPIILLQNEGSASASEVMAGALQSWKRAMIIGSKSFGKGTVQESWDLQNGGELKLSTNKWLTPERNWIHGKGIFADIEVEQHPLYALEILPISGNYKEGDFNEEIAYAQKVLNGLGYNLARADGFFDKDTADAVELYRKNNKLMKGRNMDNEFFESIREEVIKYKKDIEHDNQLRMGISVMLHKIEGEI